MTLDALIARTRSNTYADTLHRSAARFPGRPAVIANGRTVTYAEFDAEVNRVARTLLEQGLGHGDRLMLIARNSYEFAAITYATARIGVLLVPVNFALQAGEIAYLIDDATPAALVADEEFAERAASAIEQASHEVDVRAVIGAAPAGDTAAGPSDAGAGDSATGAEWESANAWLTAGDATAPDVTVADTDPIRIMYTSGTESRPKGVLHSSQSLLSQYASTIIDGEMSTDDIEIHALPMYHCAQLDCFFSVDVQLGATSIILPAPDPAAILRTIEEHRVTKLFCAPTVWIALLRHPDFDTRDLSSLRKGYYGAAPLPVEILRELARRLPNVRLWNFYGQTEMAPLATILRPHEQLPHAGSAGRAALNVETIIVDENDEPVAAGTVGEIVHRSPHAALGYWNQPDKSAEAYANGWFHSGDLGMIDDEGYLQVVDRKKDMIKTGGENVASREVEEGLYTLDGIAEVAVFGIPHPKWIEAVTAVIVPKPDSGLTEQAVHEHARAVFAGYKRPKYVVLAESLPKNPSGKILKKDLRVSYASLADGEADAS